MKKRKNTRQMYTVYLRTNKINGKQYVGQTNNFKNRESHWNSLKERYSCKIFDEERRLFGLVNFKTEILAVVDTREEAWELEKKYIAEYNTKFPNGYNISDGGSGTTGVPAWNKGLKGCYSEETLQKISEARKGEGNGMFGKEPWNKGKTYKGVVKRNVIFEYDFDGNLVKKWERLSDIEDELHISHTGISQCINGKIPSYKNRIWSYSELTKEEVLSLLDKRNQGKSHRAKKIIQHNSSGNVINTYSSITKAAEKLGVSQNTILNILKGRTTPRDNNMFFKYATD